MNLNFICLGAQKAGTDWVYDQFKNHDDYWMPPIKEIAFFDKFFGPKRIRKAKKQLNWKLIKHGESKGDYLDDIGFLLRMLHARPNRKEPDFTIYDNLFSHIDSQVADVTPGYCRLDLEMIEAMYNRYDSTKFFLCVRDPSSRLWSQAQMHVRLSRSLGDVTSTLDSFIEFATHDHVKRLSFLSESIKNWRSIDTENRFKVFNFDDLKASPDEYRAAIAKFVDADVNKFRLPANFNKKSTQPGKKKMPDSFREWTGIWFEEEYRILADLMGGKAISWKEQNDLVISS